MKYRSLYKMLRDMRQILDEHNDAVFVCTDSPMEMTLGWTALYDDKSMDFIMRLVDIKSIDRYLTNMIDSSIKRRCVASNMREFLNDTIIYEVICT